MSETQTNQNQQGLVKTDIYNGEDKVENDLYGDFRTQAQDYGQRLNDAAVKAREFAGEKFAQASDKFKELQAKDPKELVEDAKEYARQKPGQALLIAGAAGLILGLLLKRR
jgi:ElaB/YqjD/DUF883 family membrane-anchored ribosome-binding protein